MVDFLVFSSFLVKSKYSSSSVRFLDSSFFIAFAAARGGRNITPFFRPTTKKRHKINYSALRSALLLPTKPYFHAGVVCVLLNVFVCAF